MAKISSRSTRIPLVLVILFLTVLLLSGAHPLDNGRRSPIVSGQVLSSSYGEILSGTLIVKFNEGSSKSGLLVSKAGRRYGLRNIEQMFPFLSLSASKRGEELLRIHQVTYGSGDSPLHVASALSRLPEIEYAVPYRVFRISDDVPASAYPGSQNVLAVPNDPRFSEQRFLQRIESEAAWDIAKGQDGDVVIAVIDGGSDWRHIDLRSNVWVNDGEIADNGIDDDQNGLVDDVNGWNYANGTGDPTGLDITPENAQHGTWVAGIVAASTNNGEGVASASWNAKYMPVNTGSNSAEFDNLLFYGFQGIIYAAVMGADIINCSWGGIAPPDPFELDVVEFAYDQGALLVSSAGNENTNTDEVFVTPAGYAQVMSVGATFDRNDTRASFSNFGTGIDLFAPGVSILTTGTNNGYASPGGTSFASPLVSAGAALVKTRNPDFTVDQIRQQVRVTADDIDAANASSYRGRLGKGRMNMFRALSITDMPSVRIASVDVAEISGNEDGFIQGGEQVELDVHVTNFLAPVTGLDLTLIAEDPLVTITQGGATIGILAAGDTQSVRFEIELSPSAPQLHKVILFLEVAAGSYSDRDVFNFTANPPAFLNHDSGAFLTSITSEGNIGWIDTAGDITPFGAGFQFANNDLLFEGGLILASGSSRVSDAIRGTDPTVQEDDFAPTPDVPLQIMRPGTATAQEGRVSLSDMAATNPMGLSILQTSYVDTVDERNRFIIFKYTIQNTSSSRLDNLYAGLFFDWDISENGQTDVARFDASRNLGYVANALNMSIAGAGTQLLSSNAPVAFKAIDNPEEIYDDFTPAEKWTFISGGVSTDQLDQTDASSLLGTGPITLLPTCDVDVAFAIVAGNSTGGFFASADSAQALWDRELRPVRPANNTPEITTALGDATVAEGESLSFTFEGTDADFCDVTSFSLVDAPQGATLNSRTGFFRFEPSYDQAGEHPLLVAFSDGFEADTVRSRITVTNTNRAPAFVNAPADTTVFIGERLEIQFTINDPDGDVATFSLIDPPENASLDSETGLLVFEPSGTQAGQVDIRIRATDSDLSAESLLQVQVLVPDFSLEHVYPNPFQPPASISITVAEQGAVQVRIFDAAGRAVRTLVDDLLPIGLYTFQWDGLSDSGLKMAAGVYFCRLESDHGGQKIDQTIKMVVLP